MLLLQFPVYLIRWNWIDKKELFKALIAYHVNKANCSDGSQDYKFKLSLDLRHQNHQVLRIYLSLKSWETVSVNAAQYLTVGDNLVVVFIELLFAKKYYKL